MEVLFLWSDLFFDNFHFVFFIGEDGVVIKRRFFYRKLHKGVGKSCKVKTLEKNFCILESTVFHGDIFHGVVRPKEGFYIRFYTNVVKGDIPLRNGGAPFRKTPCIGIVIEVDSHGNYSRFLKMNIL